jgi:predicted lipoprotein with Yx(FWY)xxD motif
MLSRPSNFVTLAIVLVAIAGCGGSGSSTSSKSTSTSASTTATTQAPSSTSTSTSTSASAPPPAVAGVKITAATVPGLGSVLVNAQGRTLYIFEPDHHQKVTCVSSCAAVWPPVALPAGAKPTPTGAVKRSLLGSDPNPSGGHVVTYAGWPLYTYVGDAAAGQAHGQALNLNGGLWYVISPAGTVITKKP